MTFQDKRVEFELRWLPVAAAALRPCLAPFGFKCNADDTPRFVGADWPFETSTAGMEPQLEPASVVREVGHSDARFADWARGLRLRAANGLRHRDAEANWRRLRSDHSLPASAGHGRAS